MRVAPNCNGLATASALWAIRDAARFRLAGTTKQLAVAGGLSQLAEGLARTMQAKLLLGAAVRRIQADKKKVTVSLEAMTSGRTQTLDFSRVIIAIPFSTLRDVILDVNLPPGKMRAIRELPYTNISKLFVQTKSRAFEKAGLSSVLWTDTPIERVFAATPPGSQSSRGLLHVWMDGEGASNVDAMTADKRVPFIVNHLTKVLPAVEGDIESATYFSWAEFPWAKGAYCHFAPGQVRDLHPHIAPPVGLLHFAGEHTTTIEPGMEAALESGERCAREVATALA